MKYYTRITTYIAAVILLVSRAAFVDGQVVTGTPSALSRAGAILNRLVNWGLGLLISISVAFVIYAAYLFLASGGSEEDVKKARKILVYVAVAVAVGLFAKGFVYLIVKLVAP